MDIAGVVPLDENSLIKAAMRATGLSDFGTSEWLEPFRVFIKSLEEEADLHLLGRLRLRQEILLYLSARLQIEDTFKRHPEIDNEEIVQPILITGQGRSGTSFLQNMLAANPDYGTLRHWEMIIPCPPPEKATYYTDPRIAQADAWVDQWNRIAPELTGIHEFRGHMPFECTVLMSVSFLSDAWLGGHCPVPSFHAYMAGLDAQIPLRWLKRAMKLLQWKNPRKHWVLKDVFIMQHLEAVYKVFPDACVVLPHRDPVRANASFINMLGTMQQAHSNSPLREGTLEVLTNPEINAQLFNHLIDLLERGVIPGKQLCSVHYLDLVRDTMGTIDRIHDHFGIPLSVEGRAGMVQYLTDNPRDSRPAHRYAVAGGDTLAQARQAYKRYQDYFNVPTE